MDKSAAHYHRSRNFQSTRVIRRSSPSLRFLFRFLRRSVPLLRSFCDLLSGWCTEELGKRRSDPDRVPPLSIRGTRLSTPLMMLVLSQSLFFFNDVAGFAPCLPSASQGVNVLISVVYQDLRYPSAGTLLISITVKDQCTCFGILPDPL